MRTLRKSLAMLLAAVMVLGLGAFNAFALTSDDYLDAADISADYREAVDVLSYLGVLTGFDDDGDGRYEFLPGEPLTRGQAATVVCRLLGVINPTGRSSFADGDWADAFIGYMEQYNITNGISLPGEEPKLYGTNDYLTGYQFAKFLLVALGYDPDVEGMTGQGWEFGVQKLLRSTGLGEGLGDYNLNANLTREMAMQMALNALETPMVEYSGGVTVGNVTVGSERNYVTSNAGYAANIGKDGDGSAAYVELGEYYWRDLKAESRADDMGRPGKQWTCGGKDIGLYADGGALVASYTTQVKKYDLYKDLGGKNYSDTNITKSVWMDGQEVVTGTSAPAGYYSSTNGSGPSANADNTGNGVLTELYRMDSDGDGEIDEYRIVITNTYLVKAAADYSATGKSIRISKSLDNGVTVPASMKTEIKAEDFPIVTGAEKDDYLLVTYSKKDSGSIRSVAFADILTGEVNGYTTGSGNINDFSVTLDGTKYNYNHKVGTSAEKGAGAGYRIGKNATVVLDSCGYIIAVDAVDAESGGNYLYVREAEKGMNGVQARAYFPDGTEEKITLKSETITGSTGNILTVGGNDDNYNEAVDTWFSYSVSGGKYTLTALDTAARTATTGAVVDKDKVAFLNGTNDISPAVTAAGTNKTIVLVLGSNGDVTRFEGVDSLSGVTVKSGNVKVRYTLDDAGKYLKYVFIDGNVSIDGGTKNDDLMFVLDSKESGEDGRGKYVTYEVIHNGVKTTVDAADTFNLGSYKGRLVSGLKYSGKGLLENAEAWANGGDTYTATGIDGLGSEKIEAGGTILTLDGVNLNTSGANMYLIIGEDLENVKAGEYLNTSVNEIVTTLKDEQITFDWYAKYADAHSSGSGKVTDLYIYAEPGTAAHP